MDQDVWAAHGSCRQLPQLPEHSTRQVRVRHGNRPEGRPITRREMAEKVFDKLRKLMVSEIPLAIGRSCTHCHMD